MEKTTGTFDKLVDLATGFVTKQQGMWDHTSWQGFVSDTQKRGYDLSVEMQNNLGVTLEAIKQLYLASISVKGVESAMNGITTDGMNFVKQHKGIWSHAEWEGFIKDVEKNSTNLSEETLAYLGNVVEAFKTLYFVVPADVIKKTVAKGKPKKGSEKSVKKEEEFKVKKTKSTEKEEGAHDDLTAIRGIGPAIAKKLTAHGIQSYAQLAALDDQEIAKLEGSIIKFSGRIKREDWIGQAKKLT
ncbi:MAG: hypothetical protein GY938_14105 [Ketobacter sp.]|nr:hypothetical protein [Ketobacter sp.]